MLKTHLFLQKIDFERVLQTLCSWHANEIPTWSHTSLQCEKKIITLSHRALQEEGGGGKRGELKRSLNSAILIKASNLVVHLWIILPQRHPLFGKGDWPKYNVRKYEKSAKVLYFEGDI